MSDKDKIIDADVVYYSISGDVVRRILYKVTREQLKNLFVGACELVDYEQYYSVKCFEVSNRGAGEVHYNEVAHYAEVKDKYNCCNFCLI